MRILFSITYYLPYISGLTIAASRWAEGLAASGDSVTVLTMQHDKALPATKRTKNVSVVRASWFVRISKSFLSIDWIGKSWQLAGSHDVAVVNLPQFEGVMPALFAKLQGKRVVSVYHCEITLPDGFFNSIAQSLIEISNFLTLLLSETVITYTKDYATHSRLLKFLARYAVRDIVTIIPPIMPLPARTAIVERLKKRIGKADVIIGVAARLASEKGIEYLLQAIPQLQKHVKGKKVRIVIAGPMEPVGEQSYKKRIMRLVKRYAAHVVFLGSILPSDMGSFYRCIQILVLPSINSTEAFGLVQVEAMLSGIPVVASDLPGVRVPVRVTGMGIVVPPKDSTRLANAIIKISEQPDVYRKDASVIEKQFSAKRSLDAFRRVLR